MAKSEGSKIVNSTLRRKKGLKRGWLKRTQFNRSKPPRDKRPYEHASKTTDRKKSGLKAVSKKHKHALTKRYFPAQSQFLQLTENRFCWICLARSLDATREQVREIMLKPHEESTRLLMASGARCTPAAEVHHYAGRIGKLLDFVPFFVPECRECREWPHVNAKEARRLDLLAPGSQYNVFPRERAEALLVEYEKTSSFQTK